MGFFTTYKKIKGVWKKPKLRVYFGSWLHDPNLPVWRSHMVRLGKYGSYYQIRKWVELEDKSKAYYDETFKQTIKSYYHVEHNRIKAEYAWKRNIRKKLRKWGLGWIPPVIEIPWWLGVHVFNFDVMWKWKFDDVRYEFPPQFTIVFFGLSLSLTLHEPTGGYYTSDDQYWEGIISWLYQHDKDIYNTVKYGGIWNTGNTAFFSIRPEHMERFEDRAEYCRAVSDYRKQHPESRAV